MKVEIDKESTIYKNINDRLRNLGNIHTDFMNLKTGNTDDVKKGNIKIHC